ncbi:MAG: NAD(P)-dependent alcohol dehydrogenase [Rhizobiales bacterium]|nr:NAD(P)-dependent alcohol dehydrogenase [Hyphomicrobiales bacterium]
MLAVFCRTYGSSDVVTIEKAPKPEPGPGELLIRIHAATVSAADRRIRSLDVPTGFSLPVRLMFGWSRLKRPVLGTDLAGVVEEVGEGVTRFKVGDPIIANVGAALGCHAEYRTLPENAAMVMKPAHLSFEEAASLVFGGTTALFYLRDLLKLQPGEHVLINGAGGAVGSAAIQIAKAMGLEVTAVASGAKHNLVLSLGADHAVDYTRDTVPGTTAQYDAILDCFGNLDHAGCRDALKAGGRLGLVVAGMPQYLAMPVINLMSGKKVRAGVVAEKSEDLQELADLAVAGRFRPVIGACFPLDQAREAHRLLDEGHKTGNIVLRMV